ncbi:MAG: hypothetical protein L0958_01375 [Candidatus Mariimomonas ferrooxydans]
MGYKYPHNYKEHFVVQEYLPGKKTFFYPTGEGYEKIFRKKLHRRRVI